MIAEKLNVVDVTYTKIKKNYESHVLNSVDTNIGVQCMYHRVIYGEGVTNYCKKIFHMHAWRIVFERRKR